MIENREYEPSFDEPRPPISGSKTGALIGCLLFLVVIAAVGAAVYFAAPAVDPILDRYVWAPHDVVREYLVAYDNGNTARARRFTCSAIRAGEPPDPSVYGVTHWTVGPINALAYPRDDGRVAIYYTLRAGLTEGTHQAILQREEDGWRICGFMP